MQPKIKTDTKKKIKMSNSTISKRLNNNYKIPQKILEKIKVALVINSIPKLQIHI